MPVTDAPPHPFALRFAEIIAGLRATVFDYGGRRPLDGLLTVRLHRRLGRVARRFAALLAHLIQFGADAPRRVYRKRRQATPDSAADSAAAPPQTPPPAAAGGPAPPRVPPPRLPNQYAWMAALGFRFRGSGAHLQFLMENPEMQALLAASPRLVALLRPVWRMLGVVAPAAVKPLITKPKAPRQPRPRRRRWRPSRRCDLLFLTRMGKPLIET